MSRDVDFLIVGGYAVSFHGYPRATGDLDVFVNRTEENAQRLVDVFHEFGFTDNITADLFADPGTIVRIGIPPIRLEVFTEISGVTFEQCDRNRVETSIDGISVHFIGLEELIQNKRASGPAKDLVDVAELLKKPES